MAIGDRDLVLRWNNGATLEELSELYSKTPTSIASKLIRLNQFRSRKEVQLANIESGGKCEVHEEVDCFYTIYLIRSPDGVPTYVGQSQNFWKRKKTHKKKFTKYFGGLEPIIEILDRVELYSDSRMREKYFIAKFTKDGHVLLNIQDRDLC